MSPVPAICPLCCNRQNSFFKITDHVYGGNKEQGFYLCENCDVVFLFPQLTIEQEEKFYADEFSKFMEARSGDDFDWSGPQAHVVSNKKQFERRWGVFRDCIAPGKSILDIGCSSGFMLLPLKEKGCLVAGVEPSMQFTSFLKHNGIEVYPSLEDLKKDDDSGEEFDLIMHFFVLEHIRDPVQFLKAALDILKEDGTMVFEVPNRNDPLITIYDIEAFNRFYWSVAHNWYFNPTSLKYILDRLPCEYEILNEQRYDLSNHMTWAIEGKPGGQGRYSDMFSEDLNRTYLESMKEKGFCDASFVRLKKTGNTT